MRELASALAERKRNSTKSEMIWRLRLGDLRRLLRDRNGAVLPNDDAGREYLLELLLPISVGLMRIGAPRMAAPGPVRSAAPSPKSTGHSKKTPRELGGASHSLFLFSLERAIS